MEVSVVLKTREIAVLLALGLAATACGSSEEPAAITPNQAGESVFPSVEVVSLNGDATVNFASQLEGGDQAILVWFWAPH